MHISHRIDADEEYVITGQDLIYVRDLMKTLYAERAMSGDTQRTIANRLNLIEVYPLKGTNKP